MNPAQTLLLDLKDHAMNYKSVPGEGLGKQRAEQRLKAKRQFLSTLYKDTPQSTTISRQLKRWIERQQVKRNK